MKTEHLVLGIVAFATCIATYNSVQYLSAGLSETHQQFGGVERQLLSGGANACKPNGSGCLKGQTASITLDRPAPTAAGTACVLHFLWGKNSASSTDLAASRAKQPASP